MLQIFLTLLKFCTVQRPFMLGFHLILGAWQTNDANFNWIHWEVGFPDLALVYKVAIQGGCQEADVCCAADQ